MDVSLSHLDKLFEKFFDRGAVLATQIHLHSGVSKTKYLIILNRNPADSETVFFLTTSNPDFYDRHPEFKDYIRLAAKQFPFFPVETIINCRGVHSMARSELKRRYLARELEIVGALTTDLLKQIDQIVTESQYISPRHKKVILS